jgi:hypothetical protein
MTARMNRATIRCLLLAGISGALSAGLLAQASPEVTPPQPDITSQISTTLVDLAMRYPWLALIITLMGVLRLALKPVMMLLHARVAATPEPDDDRLLESVERSLAFQAFAFFLDWFGSIKIPARPAAAKAPTSTTLSLVLACGIPALLLVSGCKALAPEADPVVVRAEQTISISYETANTFVQWEASNRESIPPDVTAAADTVRTDFPPAHRAALDALAAYKADRSAYAKDKLLQWLSTLAKFDEIAKRARAEVATP